MTLAGTGTPAPALDRGGLLAGVAAATIWGLNPLLFDRLGHLPLTDVLGHRILWAAVTVLLWCRLSGRWGRVMEAAGPRMLPGLAVSAALITLNWTVFLWAVTSDRAIDAGLGYYIAPLVAVALGVAVLGERLAPLQWLGIGLALAAVAGLGAATGTVPVVSLVLAVSFALYGFVRKRTRAGAVSGFAVEAALLAPFAALWLAARGGFGESAADAALLLVSGVVTGTPLILFAEAARRLPYATAGLVQYLNPTLQVACATLALGEVLTPAHTVALGLIWAGILCYFAGLLGRRGPRAL